MKINLFTLLFVIVLSSASFAQDAAVPPPDPAAAVPAAPAVDPAVAAAAEAARLKIISQPFRKSFLFSPIEIEMIARARDRKPASSALLNADKPQAIPEKRVISLAGVLFRKHGDWIVWLNGQKVIPSQLLPEIVDISVSNDVVHLKWFDIGMNKIISISLRPHQTYDIVTGVLLPG